MVKVTVSVTGTARGHFPPQADTRTKKTHYQVIGSEFSFLFYSVFYRMAVFS